MKQNQKYDHQLPKTQRKKITVVSASSSPGWFWTVCCAVGKEMLNNTNKKPRTPIAPRCLLDPGRSKQAVRAESCTQQSVSKFTHNLHGWNSNNNLKTSLPGQLKWCSAELRTTLDKVGNKPCTKPGLFQRESRSTNLLEKVHNTFAKVNGLGENSDTRGWNAACSAVCKEFTEIQSVYTTRLWLWNQTQNDAYASQSSFYGRRPVGVLLCLSRLLWRCSFPLAIDGHTSGQWKMWAVQDVQLLAATFISAAPSPLTHTHIHSHTPLQAHTHTHNIWVLSPSGKLTFICEEQWCCDDSIKTM